VDSFILKIMLMNLRKSNKIIAWKVWALTISFWLRF